MDQLTVINLALAEIGGKKSIVTLADKSPEALASVLAYPQVIPALLRRYAWGFALNTAPMTLLRRRVYPWNPSTCPPGNWDFAYACPSDMLKPVRVLTPDCGCENPGMLRREKWRFGRIAGASVILTNADNAQLTYTIVLAPGTEASWDPVFVQAVIFALAARIAMPVTGSADGMKLATQNLANLIKDAPPDVIEDTRYEDQMRGLDYQENVDPVRHVPQFLPDFEPAAIRARGVDIPYRPGSELPDPDLIPDGGWTP